MDLKRIKNICFLFLGIFAVLMLVMAITQSAIFGYIAIAVVAVYGIFLAVFWRCPNCKKNLGALWVKHCPNCGEKVN